MIDFENLRRRLSDGMRGAVSRPGEAAYERAVSIWAKPRVLPQLVAHCESVEDVQFAVLSARENGVPLSVRGGGHDWTGRALCSGLALDMSPMNWVGAIGRGDFVEVGGGTRGVDLYAVTDPAGMAPVLGSVAVVGLAGLVKTRDLDAADAAGIRGLAVEWGYAAPELLRQAAPGRTSASMKDLRRVLLTNATSPGAQTEIRASE